MIDISNAMYRKSGLYSRIIDSLVNTALLHWNTDTIALSDKLLNVSHATIKRNFTKFNGRIANLKLEKHLNEALIRVFKEDAAYGFWCEEEDPDNPFIYWLPSYWCEVRKSYNGMPMYGILPGRVSQADRYRLPDEIQRLVESKPEFEKHQEMYGWDPYVYPDPNKCFCLKYNMDYNFVFPPFFSALGDLLDIGDYKELLKAKTEGENYNLLAFKIPTDIEFADKLMLTEKTVFPVVDTANAITPPSMGTIATPMDVQLLSAKSNSVAEKDKVGLAIDNYYNDVGVPKNLFGGASNSAELKMAITNMSGMLFKLYRQIETAINTKMNIERYSNFGSYEFDFEVFDVTQFNKAEFADHQLKMCQTSAPNKFKLLASLGINPAKLIGNDFMENTVFNLGSNWTVLKTAYTQGGSEDSVGRPSNESKDIELSDSAIQTIEGDYNNPDMRA